MQNRSRYHPETRLADHGRSKRSVFPKICDPDECAAATDAASQNSGLVAMMLVTSIALVTVCGLASLLT